MTARSRNGLHSIYYMNYEINTTDRFEEELKRLCKKYASMLDDYARLLEALLKNPAMGNNLGGNFR